MAQKVTVSMIDDMDGMPADQTVEFALDGVTYEIDLSEANAAGLREALETWVLYARRVSGRKKTSPATQTGRGQSKAIRTWAQANGFELSERGRIPHEVVAAYNTAH